MQAGMSAANWFREMNDYYSAIARSISDLDATSVEKRREVYRLAREGLIARLRRHVPPIPEIDIVRESDALEAAAQRIEAEADRSQLPDVAPGAQRSVHSRSAPAEQLKQPSGAAEADHDRVILLEFLKALELERYRQKQG
jgi:hypothetical protein